ncbi:MAG: hypothetical protein ACE10A_00620 [Acidiferrobacterales bacterium]
MTYEPSTVSQQRFELGDFELVSGAIIENRACTRGANPQALESRVKLSG